MKKIDGKKISEQILYESSIKYEKLIKKIKRPAKLVVVYYTKNSISDLYIRNKEKVLKNFGIEFEVVNVENLDDALYVIDKLNKDNTVDAIIVQLPVPNDIKDIILNKIDPKKDVDCLTEINLGKLFTKKMYYPATSQAILIVLEKHIDSLEYKNILVIGRSNLIGAPLFLTLTKKNATVTVAHTKTKDLDKRIKNADIVITATGKRLNIEKYLTNQIVIDAGILIEEGSLQGDVDLSKLENTDVLITPTPGGIGPVTIASLIKNILIAYEKGNYESSRHY